MLKPTLFDVAVAGRGVVASAMALGLAQQGLQVAMIGAASTADEPSQPDADWDARVFALSAASLALLQRLRVAAQLDARRTGPVYQMQIYGDPLDASLRVGRLSFSAYEAGVPELARIVERRNLMRALQLGCDLQTSLTVIDDRITDFLADEVATSLTLANAGPASVRARLLIVADGAHAQLRGQAGIGVREFAYGQRGVVAHFLCDQPHGDSAFQWFLQDSVLAFLPLPGETTPANHVSMVWSMNSERAEALLQTPADVFAATVARACGERLGAMRLIDAQPAAFPLRYVEARTVTGDRLALVGDAAHVMHPLAGQGLNTGLLDVAALLDDIRNRESVRDVGDRTVLRRYARSRAEQTALMMRTTDGLKTLFEARQPWMQWLRQAGLNGLDRLPALKNTLIRQAIGAREAGLFKEDV